MFIEGDECLFSLKGNVHNYVSISEGEGGQRLHPYNGRLAQEGASPQAGGGTHVGVGWFPGVVWECGQPHR